MAIGIAGRGQNFSSYRKGKDDDGLITFLLTEHLTMKDAQIRQALTDKLHLFADLAECVGVSEDAGTRRHLLLRGDTSELQQGEQLLKGAITEGNFCTTPQLLSFLSAGHIDCTETLSWPLVGNLFIRQ